MMHDDFKKKVEEKEQILSDFLENLKSAEEVAPLVRDELERTKWEKEVIYTAPESTHEIPTDSVFLRFGTSVEEVGKAIHPLPKFDFSAVVGAVGSTASASTDIYSFVERCTILPDAAAKDWAVIRLGKYQDLQDKQNVRQEVRGRLKTLKPELAGEFDAAVQTSDAFLTGHRTAVEAAITLRNVLEHTKGEILESAKRKGEQKVKWESMAERLGSTDSGKNVLLQEEERWNDLQQELSKVTKNLQTPSAAEFRSLITKWLDHLKIVLSVTEPVRKGGTGT